MICRCKSTDFLKDHRAFLNINHQLVLWYNKTQILNSIDKKNLNLCDIVLLAAIIQIGYETS